MFCCSSIYMNFLLDLDNMFEISGSVCCTYFGSVDLTRNTHFVFPTITQYIYLHDVDLNSTDFHNFRHVSSINGPHPHDLKQNILENIYLFQQIQITYSWWITNPILGTVRKFMDVNLCAIKKKKENALLEKVLDILSDW